MTPTYQRASLLQINRCCLVLLLGAIVFGGAGCSKLRNENAPGGGQLSSNSNSGQTSTVPPVAEGTPTTWEAKATSLNGVEGQTLTLACSPGGTAHTVWGSDVYTSDSSICTAAVHSGLITLQNGGSVTIQVRRGMSVYGCSERNGVTSNCYGSWGQSFVFKTPNTESLVRDAENATSVMWNTSPGMVSFEVSKTVKFSCPAGGKESTVWGTDTYTLDSSICTAAVHVGKFTRESGGTVEIELRPGESSYQGTTRNGITTNDYGKYGSSFVVK
jgi:hypothetical protein